MSSSQAIQPVPSGSETPSDGISLSSKRRVDEKQPDLSARDAPALASQGAQRMEGALGDAVLRFLRIRKGPKPDQYDLDAVRLDLLRSQGCTGS